MKRMQQLTVIIEREGDAYVGLCPEFDIASQGDSIERLQIRRRSNGVGIRKYL
jgi:hypothetical protein